jgi:Right handed beta helix region
MTMQQFLTTTVTIMKPDTLGRGVRWGFAGLAAVWIASTAAATPAAAQDFNGDPIWVTNAGDDVGSGGKTLRQAIADAQGTPDDDVIKFAAGISEIQLTQGVLLLGHLFMPPDSGWLMIDGGEDGVTLDAGGQSGVMEIQSGNVILTGLAFTNGYSDLGGGLMIWDTADVTLENSLVSDNTATNEGGGICSIGVLTISDTVVENNYASDVGGGVYIYGGYDGSLAAANLTISHNAARTGGGGLFNDQAVEVMLTDPIVSDNTARNGGGIYNYLGPFSLSGGEFTGNQADRKGNDIYYTAGSVSGDLTGLDVYEEQPKGGRHK